MRLASLGSGSRGNATLVASAHTTVMIDCGFSLRNLQRRAAARDVDLASLDAILVTHEHSDHASGVASLARHYRLPVYLSHGTASALALDLSSGLELQLFDADCQLRIGDLDIAAVAVPHDAREPVQYRCDNAGQCIGVLTDLGSVTAHVQSAFAHCDLLLLEFNHDRQMLRDGPYPPALQRRVGGDWGHLSNAQAVDLLRGVDRQRLQHLVVAHSSAKNNCRERILALLGEWFPELLSRLHWAEQDGGLDWLTLTPLAEPATLTAY